MSGSGYLTDAETSEYNYMTLSTVNGEFGAYTSKLHDGVENEIVSAQTVQEILPIFKGAVHYSGWGRDLLDELSRLTQISDILKITYYSAVYRWGMSTMIDDCVDMHDACAPYGFDDVQKEFVIDMKNRTVTYIHDNPADEWFREYERRGKG
ncbi:MAG: hypothetical protein IJW65_06410 [Clostridia bacterium]|nr:hypothetical protein [Clostridia bacterium]